MCSSDLVFILCACDPGLCLRVTVKKTGDFVLVYANKHFLPHANDSGKIVFQIPPENQPQIKDTILFYGIGTWQNKEYVMNFATEIDSIVVGTSGKQKIIKNSASIFNYLWERRKGAMKSIIEISTED